VSVLKVNAGVGGDALDAQVEVANSFPCSLIRENLGWFQDEDGGALAGDFFGDGAGDGASDLFFAVEKERYGTI
jgi:hypothetical protein